MRIQTTTLLAAAVAIFCVAGANGQGKAGAGSRSVSEIDRSRFGHIRGRLVENLDAEKVGRLKDFVVDTESGEIRFAIISTGGFPGRSSSKIVPVEALSSATAKRGIVAIDISLRRWKNAPQFKPRDLAALNDRNHSQQIYSYYGLRTSEISPPSATGREGPHVPKSALAARYRLASSLLGSEVRDRGDRKLGQISDLLIDLASKRTPCALLSAETKKPNLVVVPLRALRFSDRVRIDADANEFGQSRPFNEHAWESANTARPYVYHLGE